MKLDEFLKSSFLLAGAFAIGYNAAMALHELGHALGQWVTGGSVARISLHPFSWCYTYYKSVPRYPDFVTWSGAGLAVTTSVLLLLLGRRWRTPWLTPLIVGAICGLVANGVYLAVDAIHGLR